MKNEKDMNAYAQAEKAMKADEDKIHSLSIYPPFFEMDEGRDSFKYDGINPIWGYPGPSERGMQLKQAMFDAIRSMSDETKGVDHDDVDPDIRRKCFKSVLAEFSDDLDEASLWQKRYPNDNVAAIMDNQKK